MTHSRVDRLDPATRAAIGRAESLAAAHGRRLAPIDLLDALSLDDGAAGRALAAAGVRAQRTVEGRTPAAEMGWTSTARDIIGSTLRVALGRQALRVRPVDLLLALLETHDSVVAARLRRAGTTARGVAVLSDVLDSDRSHRDVSSDQAVSSLVAAFETSGRH